MSARRKYAPKGTDGSDGKIEVHPNSVQGPAAVNAKKVDLIELEFGALFTFGKDAVHGNQLAITAKFSRDHQVQFDADDYESIDPSGFVTGAGIATKQSP